MSFADLKEAQGALEKRLQTNPRRYALALMSIALATAARYGMGQIIGFQTPFIFYYPTIMAIGLLAGFRAGVLASVAAGTAGGFFLIEPRGTFAVKSAEDVLGPLLLTLIGITISAMAELFRRRSMQLQVYQRAVEGLEEMIVVLDRDYRILIANRAYLEYRGAKREQVLGRHASEVLTDGVFEQVVREKLDECFTGKVLTYEMKYNYPLRGERDLVITYYPMYGAQGVDRVVSVLQDVTEQKKADAALRESDARLRLFVEHSPAAVALFDTEMKYLKASRRWMEDYKLGDRDLTGVSHYEVFPEIPDEWKQVHQRALAGESLSEEMERFQRADGSEQWVRWQCRPWHGKNGRIGGIAILTEEITQRKVTEDALRASEEWLGLAHQAAHIGTFDSDIQTGRVRWNPEMFELYGVSPANFDGTVEGFLKCIHPEDVERVKGYMTRGLEDGQSEGSWRIVRGDGAVRWINGRWKIFRNESGAAVRAIGVDIDVTAQKEAEKVLRISEHKYRTLFEKSLAGIGITTLEGEGIDCNEAWGRMFGCKPEQFRGSNMVSRYLEPGWRDKMMTELRRTGSYSGEGVLRREDGTPMNVLASMALIGDGERQLIQGMLVDISDWKHAQDALRESEQRYRSLFEKSVAGVGILRLDGTILDCNDAWARIYGYGAASEMIGVQIGKHYPREGVRQEFLEKLTREKVLLNSEVEMCRIDGTSCWIQVTSALMANGDGEPQIQSTIVDVSETKRAGDALRRREEDYRRFVAQSSEGIFREDMAEPVPVDLPVEEMIERLRREAYVTECNDALARMYGLSWAQEMIGKRMAEMLVPHDEKNQELMREFCGAGFRVLERESHEVDVQGNRKIFRNSMIGIVEDGRLVRIWNIQRDVTEWIKLGEERRKAEAALRTSEERFRVALKESPITVFSQDMKRRYTWVYNTAFHPPENFLGKTPSEVIGEEYGAPLREVEERVLSTGVGERTEVWFMHEGKKRQFEVTLEPLRDGNGNIVGLTGASMNIARLRELADELEEQRDKLVREQTYLKGEIETELGFEQVIGQSAVLKEVLKKARIVAATDATVLLLGETGTGKELIARSIHSLSGRRDKTFVKLNCAAVPSGLLESELFGHEKGAFTGAVSQKVGRIELADKGTLFLDEIGELPVELQPKLLRVLQDREFERLGGVRTIKVDVRIISATNRDLRQDIADKVFREDLYYRLNVFPIEMPALRERREDIAMLVHHFVQKHAARMAKSIDLIPEETMAVLQNWNWPGNIRELENMIERMVILTKGRALAAPPVELVETKNTAEDDLIEMEREHIIRVLRETNGVVAGPEGAASRLGVKRTTLQSMLKRLGIELQDFRRGNGKGATGTYGRE